MFYSDQKPLVFIHIPRTGGTSLTQAWGTLPYISKDVAVYKHATAPQIKALIGKRLWNQAFRFTIIRDPWEILVSLWRLLMAASGHEGAESWRTSVIYWKARTFNEWLDQELGQLKPGGFLRTYTAREKVHIFTNVQDAHRTLMEITGDCPELPHLEGSDRTIPVDESRRSEVLDRCAFDVRFLEEAERP